MRKGEVILWKLMILVLRPSAVRLSKGVVGEHLANTGHVALIAVEDFACGFVLIETECLVIAQIAATLRIPIGQHRNNARVGRAQGHRIDSPRRIVGLVAQERYEVTRGSVAHTQYLWVECRIPEIVDKTWPERCALGQEFYCTRIDIGPALWWDLGVGVRLFRPYRQSGRPLLQGGGFITERRRKAGRRQARAEHKLIANRLHDGFAPLSRYRDTYGHALIGAGRIRVPTTPDQGIALTKQKPIAGIVDRSGVVGGGRRGLRRLMENGQEAFAAAIVDLI